MARVQRNKAKKGGLSVDFSDTQSSAVVEEGDYSVEVVEIEQKTSESSGADYLSMEFKILDGEFTGKKLYHNCSLQPQALFNLRGVLEALGFEVPQGVMELDTADLIGETCMVSVTHEQYEGKTKARISEFYSSEEEVETAAPTKAAKKSEAAEPVKKTKKATKPAEPEFAVGNRVTFSDEDGEELEGKVTGVDGDKVSVKVGKDEWELEASDLTLAE